MPSPIEIEHVRRLRSLEPHFDSNRFDWQINRKTKKYDAAFREQNRKRTYRPPAPVTFPRLRGQNKGKANQWQTSEQRIHCHMSFNWQLNIVGY